MSRARSGPGAPPAGRPAKPPGLLLVRGGLEAAARWSAGGLTPVVVVPDQQGWSLIVPAAQTSAAAAPYDDAMAMLLNRPLPHRLRPGLGFAVRRRQAVVSVTPAGWRAVRRWLAWQPGLGVAHPAGLPLARLADLVRAADLDDPSAVGGLADVLHDPAGEPRVLVEDVLVALDLPGGGVLDGSVVVTDLPGARLVEPSPREVRRFDAMVREDVTWRDEMEGQHR